MNRELIETAYSIIDGIPEGRFDLSNWQSSARISSADQINCGTIACAAGWLSLHPQMNEAGLRVMDDGYTVPQFGSEHGYDALAEFFGISFDEAFNLFGIRGESTYDKHAHAKARSSDKQLFLFRVRQFLNGAQS